MRFCGAECVRGDRVRIKIFTDRSLLCHTIEDATGTATSEKKSVRAAQDLDLLHIIEWAVVLHIVTHTIDKEISRGECPAEDHGITMTFTLIIADPRSIINNVPDALEAAERNILGGRNGKALRHVDNRRRRL